MDLSSLEGFGGVIEGIRPLIEFISNNPWIFDVLLLVFLLLACLAGFIRGLRRSLFHLVFVATGLILSYFIFIPMLSNWMLDDFFTVIQKGFPDFSPTIPGPEGLSITFDSLRDVFIKLGTLPTLVNPLPVEFCSDLAFVFMNASLMIVVTVILYILGWALSSLLYLFVLPFEFVAKRKAKKNGKKFKKYRLFGMIPSAIACILLYFFSLNASNAISSVFGAFVSNGGVSAILPSDAVPGLELIDQLLGALDLVRSAGQGGMIASFFSFDGFMYQLSYSWEFDSTTGEAIKSPVSFGEAINEYMARIITMLSDFLNSPSSEQPIPLEPEPVARFLSI